MVLRDGLVFASRGALMTKRILIIFCLFSAGAVLGLLGLRGESAKSGAPLALWPRRQAQPAAAPLQPGAPLASTEAKGMTPTSLPPETLTPHSLVQHLAEQLGRPDVDFTARDRALRAALNKMTDQELAVLGRDIGQGRLTGNRARATLYLLSLTGPQAVPALREIVFGKGAAAHSARGERFAFSLRVDALEQLEALAPESREAQQAIMEAAMRIEGRGLRELARIASLGVRQGNPGKLHRLMEETLKKHGG